MRGYITNRMIPTKQLLVIRIIGGASWNDLTKINDFLNANLIVSYQTSRSHMLMSRNCQMVKCSFIVSSGCGKNYNDSSLMHNELLNSNLC